MTQLIELVHLEPQTVLVVRKTIPRNGLGEFFMTTYPRLVAELLAQGATIAGMPFSRYYSADPAGFDVEAGMAFTGKVKPPAWAAVSQLPGSDAAKTVHIGPYETVSAEYPRLQVWIAQSGRRADAGPWEVYIDNDEVTPQETLRTEVYWPLVGA